MFQTSSKRGGSQLTIAEIPVEDGQSGFKPLQSEAVVSGSGKSSLVQAGLVPALRAGRLPGAERWRIVVLTPGAQLLEQLAAVLEAEAGSPSTTLRATLTADEQGLLRAVASVLPADPRVELVVVIDQFEELFTLVDDNQLRQHLLVSLLVALRNGASRLRVIVTLRGDFYDRPLQNAEFGKLLLARTMWMEPLSSEQPDELRELATNRSLVIDSQGEAVEDPVYNPTGEWAVLQMNSGIESVQGSTIFYNLSSGTAFPLPIQVDLSAPSKFSFDGGIAWFADEGGVNSLWELHNSPRLLTTLGLGVETLLFDSTSTKAIVQYTDGRIYALDLTFLRSLNRSDGVTEDALVQASCAGPLASNHWWPEDQRALEEALVERPPQVCS